MGTIQLTFSEGVLVEKKRDQFGPHRDLEKAITGFVAQRFRCKNDSGNW
jgi:hypothetical protein